MLDLADRVLLAFFLRDVRPSPRSAVAPRAVREKRDLGRQKAESEGIIERKILKLVGADDVLSSLRRLIGSGIARNELRAKVGRKYGTENDARWRAQLVCIRDPASWERWR